MASLLCPHCKKSLEVKQVPAVGTLVRCFLCNNPFVVEQTSFPKKTPPATAAKPSQNGANPANRADLGKHRSSPISPLVPLPPPPHLDDPFAANPMQQPFQYSQQQPWNQNPYGNQFPGGHPGYQPYGAQGDDTPFWVKVLLVVAGGSGVSVLLVLAVLSLMPRTPTSVAQVPVPAPTNQVVTTPVTPPAGTPPPVSPIPATAPRAPVPPPPMSAPQPPPAAPTPPEASVSPDTTNTNNQVASNSSNAPAFGMSSSNDSNVNSQPAIETKVDTNTPSPNIGSTAPAGLAYQWKLGQRYPFHFRIKLDPENAASNQSGMVTYVPAAAESKKLGGLIKGQGGQATGTAFVIHSDGLLATCDHVIRGANKIEVTIGQRKYTAKTIARDSKNDLALLQVDAKGLPVLPLGSSEQLRLLEDVYALGFPLSDVLGKKIKATPGTLAGLVDSERSLLQINAGINPGNSGGPLVNSRGEAVGVCSAKLVGEEISNVGLAVPISRLMELLQSKGLSANGTSPGAGKIDASTMAEKSAAAVAYVQATLGTEVAKTVVLNFSGFCSGRNVFGSTNRSGQALVTRQGESLGVSGDQMLPAFIGSFANMVIDKLPDEGETNWETGRTSSVSLEVNSNERSSLRYSPYSGIGRPQQIVVCPMLEKASYQLGERNGDLITIQKKHTIVVLQQGNQQSMFAAAGEGTISFDVGRGLPIKSKMDYVYLRASNQGEVRIPIEFSYELGKEETQKSFDDRIAKMQADQEAEKNRDKTSDVLLHLEVLLNDKKKSEHYNSLDKIRHIPAIPGIQEEVAQAIDKLLMSKDSSTRRSAQECVKIWGTETNVPTLLKLIDSLEDNSRRNAIEALGKVSKSPKVAEVLIQILKEQQDSSMATSSLKSMGSAAEEPLLALIDSEKTELQCEAISILGAIGTKVSLPKLNRLAQDKSNSRVSVSARLAIERIKIRLDQK